MMPQTQSSRIPVIMTIPSTHPHPQSLIPEAAVFGQYNTLGPWHHPMPCLHAYISGPPDHAIGLATRHASPAPSPSAARRHHRRQWPATCRVLFFREPLAPLLLATYSLGSRILPRSATLCHAPITHYYPSLLRGGNMENAAAKFMCVPALPDCLIMGRSGMLVKIDKQT